MDSANFSATEQSESVLIQRIYTHFKKAPGTHKLGVLYVVDSVTRQWVEHARKPGQPSGPAANDGTFAAGVKHVTELLPSFMNDIITTAPEDQKVRFLERPLRAIVWPVYASPVGDKAMAVLYLYKNDRLNFFLVSKV